ncbi:MAG: hypothetical protein Q4D29_12610 [Lachnospiraceae bacterium]|nr:hypothetical protein [Lachnospiraceae bacterium]
MSYRLLDDSYTYEQNYKNTIIKIESKMKKKIRKVAEAGIDDLLNALSLNPYYGNSISDVVRKVKISFSDEIINISVPGLKTKRTAKKEKNHENESDYTYNDSIWNKKDNMNPFSNLPKPINDFDHEQYQKLYQGFTYTVLVDYDQKNDKITLYLKAIKQSQYNAYADFDDIVYSLFVYGLFQSFYYKYKKQFGIPQLPNDENEIIIVCSIASFIEQVFAKEVLKNGILANAFWDNCIAHAVEIWPCAGIQGIHDIYKMKTIFMKSMYSTTEACLAILTEVPYLHWKI